MHVATYSIHSKFCVIDIIAPQLKDLCQVAIPRYAANWKMLGTLLGVQNCYLSIIETDDRLAVNCCRSMLATWIEMDKDATWDKFYDVLKSPAFKASISK